MKGYVILILVLAGFFTGVGLGKACAPTPSITPEKIDRIIERMNVFESRIDRIEKEIKEWTGRPPREIIRIIVKSDTAKGEGKGEKKDTFFYYHDSKLDFRANLITNEVKYRIFYPSVAILFLRQNSTLYAKAVTEDGKVLAVNSIEYRENKRKLWIERRIGYGIKKGIFGEAELRFWRLGVKAEISYKKEISADLLFSYVF